MSQATDTLAAKVEAHIDDIGEDMILSDIEDIKEEYISDWEDEYESVYEEQGRGEAESCILQRHARDVLGPDASTDEMASFMEEMAYQLGLSLN